MGNQVRTCGINPDHWYVVARAQEIGTDPLAVTLWQQDMVLYRDRTGKVHALEDRCPHRQVKLSEGRVVNQELECLYHGWRFNSDGQCVSIPYLTPAQKLPNCQIRSYPVREVNGFIWVFPGNSTPATEPLPIPEWDHLNYIASVAVIDCQAHFSYLIENLMDMHHGHLHEDYQAWAAASLEKIETTPEQVQAFYQAQSYYRIDQIWSIAQLFFPSLRQLHPEPLTVTYVYPHWRASLGQDFKIYCLLAPVHPRRTRAYLIHFTSLQAFPRLHRLPDWFRRFVKNRLFGSAQKLLDGLVEQDIKMIEQEQQAYDQFPGQRSYEVNPTLMRVQQLIISNHQQLVGKS